MPPSLCKCSHTRDTNPTEASSSAPSLFFSHFPFLQGNPWWWSVRRSMASSPWPSRSGQALAECVIGVHAHPGAHVLGITDRCAKVMTLVHGSGRCASHAGSQGWWGDVWGCRGCQLPIPECVGNDGGKKWNADVEELLAGNPSIPRANSFSTIRSPEV